VTRIDPILRTRPYTGRDFATIQQELLSVIRAVRPNDINSFFEGDIAKLLIELLAYTGDGLHFAIDRVSEEAFIATMRNKSSALRHAASLGYRVAGPVAASVDLVPTSYADIPQEVSQAASANEVQTVTFSNAPTRGSFSLRFNSEDSLLIPYDAAAVVIQSTLEQMVSVGVGNVVVSGDTANGIVVTFQNALGWQDVSALSVQNSTLGRNEVQTIATGGTYTLTFNAQTTSSLAYNANAAAVQAALEALGSVGSGNVSVTGGPLSSAPLVITFIASKADTDQNAITVTSSLTGSSPVVTVTETTKGGACVSTVTETVKGVDNTYTVTFDKGQSFNSGELYWEVAETVTISGLDVSSLNYLTTFVVPIAQGISFSETFESSGQAFQSYTTTAKSVIDGSVVVRVGSSTSDPWTQVDALSLADGAANVFVLKRQDDDSVVIEFGDNILGAVPPSGLTVFITGRTGGGVVGNVGPGALKPTITGTATGGPLGTISVTVTMTNAVSASGGQDSETTEDIKQNIPAWVRTVDKAITREDYNTLSGQFESSNGAIGRAAAYLDSAAILYQRAGDAITPSNPMTIPGGTQIQLGGRYFEFSKDFVASETDPIIWLNPNVVRVYGWSAGDKGYVGASTALLQDLRLYLQGRSVVTTTIVTQPGRNKVIDIDLGTVKYYSTYSVAEVEQAIIDATRAFFLSDKAQPGEPWRLSDYYRVIEELEQVDHLVIVSPTNDVTIGKDEMPYLGVLSYNLEPTQTTLYDPSSTLADELFN